MKNTIKIILLIWAFILCTVLIFACDNNGSVTLSIGGSTVYCDSPEQAVWQISANGKKNITLKNRSGKDAELILYTDSDTPRTEIFCEAGKSSSVSTVFNKTDKALHGIAVCGEKTVAYVFDADGLRCAAEDADCIYLLSDIDTDSDLSAEHPMEIHTGENSLKVGNISLNSDKEGEFLLDGNISASSLFASAPKCALSVPETLLFDDAEFRIAAASVNGKAANGARTATSEEQLEKLCDPDSYPKLQNGETVILKDLDITKETVFDSPVTVKNANAHINADIVFDTQESGTVEIENMPSEYIKINAPQCRVLWQECPWDIFGFSEFHTAESLNGTDLDFAVLGGGTERELEIRLDGSDIVWQRSAPYTYTATLTSPVMPSTLRGAALSVSENGEKCETVIDSYCLADGKADLLCQTGTSFTLDGTRYRIITESQCRLPVVEIDTDGTPIDSKEEFVSASISVNSEFSADGLPSLPTTEVQIAGRGNSTWKWSDKKPYKLKFNSDVSLLGLEGAENWVLLANYADKSLIRNYVALESAKILDKIDGYATQYPVDVFLNGEYAGVYTLGEKVEVGRHRAFLREDGGSVDSGFLLELNGGESDFGDERDIITTSSLGPMKIVHPGRLLTAQQSDYIREYIRSVDRTVVIGQSAGELIDYESLADFMIINELTYNSDGCFRRSMFFAKDAGGPLRISQVWDFDLAFGNSAADGRYNEWACLADYGYVNMSWSRMLMRDKSFMSVMKERWNKNKDALLTAALEAAEHGEYLVSPSADANFEKWDIMYMRVGMQSDATTFLHTYSDQTEYMRSFINDRWEWIDAQLGE